MRAHFYQRIVDELPRHPRFALGLISSVKGSSPQKQGAKALFFPDGSMIGTLGGGCLEAEVRLRARDALASGKPATFELTLDHDYGWDDGLICGGKVSGLVLPNAAESSDLWHILARRESPRTWGVREDYSIVWADESAASGWLYRETVVPPLALWIAGSGHVAQAVAPLALDLDFDVTVFDDRPDLANSSYFPRETRFRVGIWEDLLKTAPPANITMGLIVTRGHKHDAKVLEAWVHQPFLFLGMIGSSRKWRMIREGFIKTGVANAAELDRVSCPVGVEIDAISVQEIAVSIMAQYIQKRHAFFLS